MTRTTGGGADDDADQAEANNSLVLRKDSASQLIDGHENQIAKNSFNDLRLASTTANFQHNSKQPPTLFDSSSTTTKTTTLTSEAQTSGNRPARHEQWQDLKTSRGRFGQFLILILFVVGLIVCVSSILCILFLPAFVSNQISKRLVLKNNSLLLDRWAKPNVPMYFKVWVFDIKNARELLDSKGAKPQLEEIGPFVFNLRRQKDVISFAGDNLYYTEKKVYHFNRELSCCAINRTVTIPNIPLVAVVDRALSYNLPLVGRLIPRLINRAIQSLREQLFVRKQVGEILFDGYEVDLLKMVSRIGSLVGLPQQSQRFALLKGRNDTWRPEQDGVWAINTGARDRRQFGRVSSWNSYRQLPFWSGSQCNAINGSDGTLFPPPIKSSEPLYIFNQELCRTVNLVYDRPSDVRSIKAYRFVLNPLNFAHTVAPSAAGPPVPPASSSILARPTTPPVNPLVIANSQPPPRPTTAAVPPASPATGAAAASLKPHRLTTASDHQHHHLHQPESNKPAPLNQPHSRQSNAKESRPSHEQSTSQISRRMMRVRRDSAAVPAGTTTSAAGTDQQHQQQQPTATPTASQKQQQLKNQEKFVQAAQQIQLDNEKQAEPTKRNPQTCFCDRKSTNLKGVNVCEFDGLIDLSKCSKQAQVIFGSMPHFHNGDQRLLRQVEGLQPNASRHTTYLDIEPNTGLVLGGKRRVQLNLLIKHNNQVDGFENVNDMLVPIVWFEESAQIPEESARKFKSLYTDRIRLVNLTLISLLVASIVLLIIDARLLFTTHYWRQLKLSLVVASVATVPAANGKGAAQQQRPDGSKRRRRLFRRPPPTASATTTTTSLDSRSQRLDGNNLIGSSDETFSSSSAADLQEHFQRQRRQLRRIRDSDSLGADETDANLTKRSDSPLLNSSTTTDSECSPASSPELRKWAPTPPPPTTTNQPNATSDNVSNLLIVNGQHRNAKN